MSATELVCDTVSGWLFGVKVRMLEVAQTTQFRTQWGRLNKRRPEQVGFAMDMRVDLKLHTRVEDGLSIKKQHVRLRGLHKCPKMSLLPYELEALIEETDAFLEYPGPGAGPRPMQNNFVVSAGASLDYRVSDRVGMAG